MQSKKDFQLEYRREMPKKLDASKLFEAVGLKNRPMIEMNEHTYGMDMEQPENNWLYPAFRGFQECQKRLGQEHQRVETFTTIGTGSGIDAIGAYEIFRPHRVIMTDIHPDVLPLAAKNFSLNTEKEFVVFETLKGDLLQPLKKRGWISDVIYANLPNVPFVHEEPSLLAKQLSASFYIPKEHNIIPRDAERYLLAMQYIVLHDAREVLTHHGSVLLNLGARVPCEVVKNIFQEIGYSYEELFVMLKKQTEAELMLPSYAKAEVENGVEFDFYRLTDAQTYLAQEAPGAEPPSVDLLKSRLERFRVNASTAWREFHEKGTPIGHIVSLLRGVKM